MKKNVFHLLLIIVMMALIVISCKSTPDTSDTSAEKEAAKAAELEAEMNARAIAEAGRVNEAKTKAQAARQQALDFQCHDYFPSDWEGLEAQYEAAENAAEYSTAENAYNELFRKTIPLYAQAREDEIIAARDQLIGTGFTQYFPQYLKDADDIALAAYDQYEAGDYYKSRETAAEALNEYETLLTGARVFLARQEIIDRGFIQYDSDNFSKADEVIQTAIEAYETGNKEEAVASAEEALLRYNLVLANGWTTYASERKDTAVLEREQALTERANIASRDTFREAESFYNQAEEQFAQKNFNDAALFYVEAEALYAISRQETAERRLRAEEAIRMAEEKIGESSESAIEAERLIEGGVR